MTPRTYLALAIFIELACVGGLPGLAGAAEPPASLQRFALLVGANDGGAERVELRYAEKDARVVDAVLLELGGVQREDRELLLGPTPESLHDRLQRLSQRMAEAREAGHRVELVFYYSGHSDEQGLRLGSALLPYRRLREWLEAVPADVRIAVLDSCSSGTLTRLKGGKRRAPFVFDTSTYVRGHAFLTSSSADEAAQESDRIGGSYFTHYLVSGLRGAADSSGDSKVTLTEAYRFAFDETLERTGSTRSGAQHPAYDIQLVGTGDLVMTDLRATSALLQLSSEVEGRLYIRDARGRLVAELYKPSGHPMELGMPSGRYELRLEQPDRWLAARVEVPKGGAEGVTLAAFRETERERTTARGDRTPEDYLLKPVMGALFDRGDNRAHPWRTHLGFNLVYGSVEALDGVQLGLLANGVTERTRGAQISVGFNYAGGWMRGVQTVVGANYAEDLGGLQTSVGGNLALRLHGLQGSSGINMVLEQGSGVQVAIVNWAKQLHGLQLGILNVGERVEGVQASLLNIATGEARGLQLGLVNYADEADAAVGMVSATRQGGVHGQLGFSTLSMLQASLRLDARHTYSLLSIGVHPIAGQEHVMFGLGLGLKIDLPGAFWLDLDTSFYAVFQDYELQVEDQPNVIVQQVRLLARYPLTDRFALLAGPTLNVVMNEPGAEDVQPGFDLGGGSRTGDADGGGLRVRVTPGVSAGVMF